MDNQPLIRIRNLEKRYGQHRIFGQSQQKIVLADINLELFGNQSVALVGASGSGKSTLCRLILGLEKSTHGDIVYSGKPLSSFDANDWRAYHSDVQLVFQDSISAVNPRQKIVQVLSEPLQYLRGLQASEINVESRQLIQKVGLPMDALEKKAGQLSGGQLQRVCIARALAAKPKMLALDESLSGLDVLQQQQIMSLLKDIQQQDGTSLLLITHDLRLVDRLCDEVVVLDAGRIVERRISNNYAPWTSDMGKKLNAAILSATPSATPSSESNREPSGKATAVA